jgi:hypothetical protein
MTDSHTSANEPVSDEPTRFKGRQHARLQQTLGHEKAREGSLDTTFSSRRGHKSFRETHLSPSTDSARSRWGTQSNTHSNEH